MSDSGDVLYAPADKRTATDLHNRKAAVESVGAEGARLLRTRAKTVSREVFGIESPRFGPQCNFRRSKESKGITH